MMKKGYKQTEEHKNNIRKSILKKYKSTEHIENHRSGCINSYTPERRKNTSEILKGKLKGNKHFNYGKHLSLECRHKISLSNKGQKRTAEQRQRMSEGIKKSMTLERRNQISKIVKKTMENPEVRKKLSVAQLGSKRKPFTEEHKKKLSIAAKESRKYKIIPIKDSKIEVKIQIFLKLLGIEYFTHQYMKIEHGYQCDILIPSLNLIIECDGMYWHKYPIGNLIDIVRTRELLEKGFRVLRFWESEINAITLDEFKFKLEQIKNGR